MFEMDMNELNKFLDCKNAFESAQQKIGGEAKEIYLEYFKAGTQHQQAKVEELQTQLSLQRQRVKAFEEELTSSRNYGDELQKRVDAVKGLIEDLNKCYQQDHQNKFEYWRGFADSAGILGKRLEQALKGEGQ